MKCLSIFFIFLIIAEMCGSLNRDDYTSEEFVGTEWCGPDGARLQFISHDSVAFTDVKWDSIFFPWEKAKEFPSSGIVQWELISVNEGEPCINLDFPGVFVCLSLRQRRWETQIYEYIGDPDELNVYVFQEIEGNNQRNNK